MAAEAPPFLVFDKPLKFNRDRREPVNSLSTSGLIELSNECWPVASLLFVWVQLFVGGIVLVLSGVCPVFVWFQVFSEAIDFVLSAFCPSLVWLGRGMNYKVGGNRNFGYGKKMHFAGLQALRDRYSGGHFASIDAHSSRWGAFCDWSIERGVKDARDITIEHVNEYVKHLKNEVLEEELKPAYAQNLVSSVNVILGQMRGDDAMWARPAEVGERCSVRDTVPIWMSRDDVDEVRTRIEDPRFTAMVDLAREFGLRFRECCRLDADHALRQAMRSNQITVSEGVKGGNQERTVPVTSPRQIGALRAAAEAQQRGPNLMRANQTYSQFKNQAYKTFYAAGGSHFHDLRAAYACDRYQELTGCKAPVLRESNDVKPSRSDDRAARLIISKELGHHRIEVVNEYIGGRR